MTLPIIRSDGPAFEQGLHHGTQLRERVAHNLEVYLDRFLRESRLTRSEVMRRAALYGPQIAVQNPDYYDGMKGIAEGSGRELDEIVALNVRYELIYYQAMVNALAGKVDGCTSFAVSPAASANGNLLMGQNWDWIPRVKGAIVKTAEPDGLRTLAFTEAGIFGGKIGLNSAGLGLAVNGLTSTSDDWSRLSKPFHVRCYEVLRQRQLEKAVFRLTGTSRACSANFLVAQAPDRMANLETAPNDVNVVPWQSGIVVHTNHFLDPAGIGISEPPNERRQYSCARLDRMRSMLSSGRPISVQTVKGCLRDHRDAPAAICRHEDPDAPVGEQYRTVTSVVMDLNQQAMYVSDGPPCENRYQIVTMI